MGLDMYLSRVPKVDTIEELKAINARLNVAYVAGNIAEELKAIKKEKGYIYDIYFTIEIYCDIEKWKMEPEEWGNPIELEIRMAYWRKFNALHNWFVQNVQDGTDDCGNYLVTIDHLKKLKLDLGVITKENASQVLPTAPGFFFGGTEYDEYYWENIDELKNIVAYLISQQAHDTCYLYSSSW